jgi:hypothetical protein
MGTTKFVTHRDMFQLCARPVYNSQEALHHATAHERFPTGFVTRKVVQETEQSSGKRQGKLTACSISICRCQCHDTGTDQHRKETVIRSGTRHIDYHVQSGTRFSVSKPSKTRDITKIHKWQQCTDSHSLSHTSVTTATTPLVCLMIWLLGKCDSQPPFCVVRTISSHHSQTQQTEPLGDVCRRTIYHLG